MHRKQSSRFPTPADIIRLLPDCRVSGKYPALEDNRRANPEYVEKLRAHYEKKWAGEKSTVQKVMDGVLREAREEGKSA